MQTFLPYRDFEDNKRLGKQRVEAMQILNCIYKKSGWKNHPVVKMWTGYEEALKMYHDIMIIEWKKRGFKNTMKLLSNDYITMPWWLGNPEFHLSHQSNLIRKLPDHYCKFFPKVSNNLPYFWPS
jgi:hypothetical protein